MFDCTQISTEINKVGRRSDQSSALCSVEFGLGEDAGGVLKDRMRRLVNNVVFIDQTTF